jgi:hypothetical protein
LAFVCLKVCGQNFHGKYSSGGEAQSIIALYGEVMGENQ